jgi:putative membrane protein
VAILNQLAIGFTALVAVEHVYILVLEMFLWTTPRGRKAFGTTQEFALASKALAANQGLYNGFLAAGLFWGLAYPDAAVGLQLKTFFLACVIVAAIYGGITAKRSILLVQGLPALIAMILVRLAAG